MSSGEHCVYKTEFTDGRVSVAQGEELIWLGLRMQCLMDQVRLPIKTFFRFIQRFFEKSCMTETADTREVDFNRFCVTELIKSLT